MYLVYKCIGPSSVSERRRPTSRALHAPFRVFVLQRRRPLEESSRYAALAPPECGNRRSRAGGRGAAEESWIASRDRRADRGRRRVLGRGAGRGRLPWWRATVRRLVRRGGRGPVDLLPCVPK